MPVSTLNYETFGGPRPSLRRARVRELYAAPVLSRTRISQWRLYLFGIQHGSMHVWNVVAHNSIHVCTQHEVAFAQCSPHHPQIATVRMS